MTRLLRGGTCPYELQMAYGPEIHRRRSIRLRGYDYAQPGAYFITVCTHGGRQLFGAIREGELRLNEAGKIVAASWHDLPRHYPHVALDEFVVMPNHVHGVIVLTDVGAGLRPAPTPAPTVRRRHALPEIVRAFKSFSARRVRDLRGRGAEPVWQRNYYEHVIRRGELDKIREYVRLNPLRWTCDRYNPGCGVLVIDETGRMVPWKES